MRWVSMGARRLLGSSNRPCIVQTLAVEGFSKALLLRLSSEPQILEALLFLYFHPSTSDLDRMKQCLAFFIQAFASSSSANQSLIAHLTVPLIISLMPYYSIASTTQAHALTITGIAQQFLLWTDSQFLFQHGKKEETHGQPHHLVIALDLCTEALADPPQRLKLFAQLVNKCKLSVASDPTSLARCLTLTGQLLKVSSSCPKMMKE